MPTYSPTTVTVPVTVTGITHTTQLAIAPVTPGQNSVLEETESISYTAKLIDLNSVVPLANQTVVISVLDPVTQAVIQSKSGATNVNGYFVASMGPFGNPGTLAVKATYAGATGYSASTSATLTLTVLQRTVATSLSITTPSGTIYEDTAYTFTATLTAAGSPLSGMTITLSGSFTGSGVTDASGNVGFSITFPNAGSYSLVFTFGGYTTAT